MDQLINASVEVYGMSSDQAALAAIYTTPFTVSPDLNHISIGGPLAGAVPPNSSVVLKMPPQGLDFPHTSVEVDASPSRLDKYSPEAKDNTYDLHLPLFRQLLDLQTGVADPEVNFSVEILSEHRLQRYKDSIATNPNFFLQPFGGLFLNGNKYQLIPQLFANRSAEHPDGRLDRNTLMSFFGVSLEGQPQKLRYNRGWERIPDNWYRRPRSDPYTLQLSNHDLVFQAKRRPDLLGKFGIGGNLGRVNDTRNVLPEQLTNGTYTQATLLDGYNLSCFAFVASYALAPYWVSAYYRDWGQLVMQKHFAGLITNSKGLNCTPLAGGIDAQKWFGQFPGWGMSLPNGTAGL